MYRYSLFVVIFIIIILCISLQDKIESLLTLTFTTIRKSIILCFYNNLFFCCRHFNTADKFHSSVAELPCKNIAWPTLDNTRPPTIFKFELSRIFYHLPNRPSHLGCPTTATRPLWPGSGSPSPPSGPLLFYWIVSWSDS